MKASQRWYCRDCGKRKKRPQPNRKSGTEGAYSVSEQMSVTEKKKAGR